ncbi:MAG TPA: SPOR domain-containing protein [Balneolales bacterium]|nr:SPOR domain-containing protein [Balneolales bacterium]
MSTRQLNAQNNEQKPSQIFLSFNYKGLVNNVVTVYYTKKDIYLPIGQVFDLLKINNEIDKTKNKISGFFLKTKTKYFINFNSLEAKIGNQSYTLDRKDFISSELDYYVKISILKKLFGLNFTPNMRDLSITLISDNTLPIESSLKRQKKDQTLSNIYEGRTYYPLLFNRRRYAFKTGMLDYNINSTYNGKSYSNNFDFTGGLKFLKGNLIGDVGGLYADQHLSGNINNLQWQYVAKDGDPVTQIYLGDLYSNGLNSQAFEGIRITNEPIHERLHFGKYVVDGDTRPNYDVELFLNGRLVAHTKTGESGHYHMVIPLEFGTSSVQIKYYGPQGQFREEDKRIQIPYTFLPAGDISYSLNAGGLTLNRQTYYEKPSTYYLAPNLAVGFTNWFTNKIGLDYGSNMNFYNISSFRISTPYLASVTLSPHNLYKATFNAVYPSQLSFQFQASHFDANYYFNNYGRSYDQGNSSMYLPFHIFNHPFNIRLSGDIQHIISRYNYGYGIGLNANWNRVTLTSSYNTNSNGGSNVNTNAYLSLVNARRLPFFLKGSLISTSVNYNGSLQKVTNFAVEYSRTVFKYARFQLSWFRDLTRNQNSFQFRLIFNLPSMISTTSYQSSSNNHMMTQNFRGGVGYDSHNNYTVFNNRRLTGSASAAVRMFVDYNGNGIQDKGEPNIHNGSVSFDQAVSQRKDGSGLIHIVNLQPYYRYNISIDGSTVKNPLWVPSKTQFSFIANPNIVTPIDIPFYVSGVVNGSVSILRDGSKQSVPGMKVHFEQTNGHYKKTITTFSDGTFYYIGLPPGKYKVYPDKKQMDILKSESKPKKRTFTLKSTKNGDNIDHLDFLLENKTDTTTYAVQAGSFHNIDLAIQALKKVNRKESPQFYVRFVKQDSLFRITTNCFKHRSTADSMLNIIKRDYPDAIERKCASLNSKLKFQLHIASLKKEKDAKTIKAKAQSNIKQTIKITHDTTSHVYNVHLPDVVNWQTAFNEREQLSKKGFENLVIKSQPQIKWLNSDFTFKVQIAVYDSMKLKAAQYVKRVIKRKYGFSAVIYNDKISHKYRLFLKKNYTWQQAQKIRNDLDNRRIFRNVTVFMLKKNRKIRDEY